jgi:hypothetical protein
MPITVVARLRHEPSSPSQTLGPWVRIPFEAWMLCAFVLCVRSGIATGWSTIQGVLQTVYRIKKLKKRQRSKGLYRQRERERVGTGLIWFRIEVSGGLLWMWQWTFGFRKMLGKFISNLVTGGFSRRTQLYGDGLVSYQEVHIIRNMTIYFLSMAQITSHTIQQQELLDQWTVHFQSCEIWGSHSSGYETSVGFHKGRRCNISDDNRRSFHLDLCLSMCSFLQFHFFRIQPNFRVYSTKWNLMNRKFKNIQTHPFTLTSSFLHSASMSDSTYHRKLFLTFNFTPESRSSVSKETT